MSSLSPSLPNVSPSDVVIGRGRRIKEHPGNLRFQAIIKANLSSYADALTKTKKSLIILKILNVVRSEGDTNFVKLASDGSPIVCEEAQARITIAQNLRDRLNVHYKSSRQHKQRRRLQIKRATATAHYLNTTGASLPCSSLSLSTSLFQMQRAASTSTSTEPLAMMRQVSGGSSGPSSIQDILDQAVGIATASAPASSTEQVQPFKVSLVEEETAMDDDVFTSLFKAFAPAELASNPFEPTPFPIAEEQQEEASFGSLEDDWEPFPLMGLL